MLNCFSPRWLNYQLRNVAKKNLSKGYDENAVSAKKGGGVARRTKKDYELQTGQKVVSKDNFLPKKRRVKKLKTNKKI